MKHTVPAFVLLVLGLLAAGCAGVIPADLRGEVDRGLTLPALQRDPEGHRGRVALLGGELLDIRTQANGYTIEVLHRPLDAQDRPILTGDSEGRFVVMVSNPTPSDPGFREGQPITVVGGVTGEVQPRVEKDLPSPILEAKYLHLWSAADYAPPPPIIIREPIYIFRHRRARNPCD